MANRVKNGLGAGTVLLIIFIVLKLTHTIDWSWWWVLSPLWIPGAFFFVVFLLGWGAYSLIKNVQKIK